MVDEAIRAMMVEGWKDISAAISAWTRRDISPEAARQLARRDPELKKRLQYFAGRPAIPRYELDTWLAMQGLKARRKRAAVAVLMRQTWLSLV